MKKIKDRGLQRLLNCIDNSPISQSGEMSGLHGYNKSDKDYSGLEIVEDETYRDNVCDTQMPSDCLERCWNRYGFQIIANGVAMESGNLVSGSGAVANAQHQIVLRLVRYDACI